MKKLFLLLAVFGMIFTACGPVDDGNNNAEQPGEETVFITDYEGNIVVGADGGVVVVTVSTNLEYSVEIPEEAQSWLSIANTRAIRLEKLTFTVAKNEADAERRAIVKLLGSDNAELQSLLFVQEGATAEEAQAIKFQDENTKLLCTLHWDENEDGELSYEEAAAVTDLGTAFKGSSILAFSELEYFTSLEKIADNAFMGCVSLVKITLPEQVTAIGASAFNGCTNLKKITVPDSVTSIGEGAFDGCTSLARVDISDLSAWCKIGFGDYANPLRNGAKLYLDNNEITELVIPSDITEIKKDAFQGCTSLTSVTIPDSVTEIGGNAFRNCSSLTSVTIPDSVTSIGKYAFSYCTSLAGVTIGNSVTKIGEYAFYNCSSLTTVYCKPTTPPAGDYSMFNNNASGRKIYVPRNSVDAYKSASYWSNYKNGIYDYDF